MIIVVGEILFDIFEDKKRIGGAPFNFAYHLKHMGLPVRFITRVGDDNLGHQITTFLGEKGFALEDVQVDKVHPTGQVRVTLDDRGVPRFDILTDVAYDFIDLAHIPPIDWAAVDLVYFGTLAQRSAYGFNQWQRFLNHSGARAQYFCDINLRLPHVAAETVRVALERADILKLNTDELAYVQKLLGSQGPWEPFVDELMTGCGLDLLALTRGEQGSVLYSGGQIVTAPLQPSKIVVDTVGAGDAYAAVLAMGWVSRLPLARIADLASDFAGRICAVSGAVPDDEQVYDRLRQHL